MSSTFYYDYLDGHDPAPEGANRPGLPAWDDDQEPGAPVDIKEQYLMERYRHEPRLFHVSVKGSGLAPAASLKRRALLHFGGFGALCAIGALAALQTGPFPLNVAVGAAITALFVADTAKKIRAWRAKAP